MSDSLPMGSSQHLATTSGGLLTFTGTPKEDIKHWIRLFELIKITRSLDDDLSRLLFLTSINGEAKIFYTFIRGVEMEMYKVINAFIRRFDPGANIPQAQELMDSLIKLPGETWVGFVERFTIIARQCQLPESFQVACISKRLPRDLQIMLSTVRLASADITVNGIIEALQMCQNRGLDMILNSGQFGDVNTIQNKFRNRKRKWCDTHKWCHHTTDKCKGITSKNKSNRNYSSFNYFVREIGIIDNSIFNTIIEFKNGEKYAALLDTGADVSCNDYNLCNKLRSLTAAPKTINSFNGQHFEDNITPLLKVKVFDIEIEVKFVAVKNLASKIIIGKKYLADLIERVGLEKVFGKIQPSVRTIEDPFNTIINDYYTIMQDEITTNSECKVKPFRIITNSDKPIVRTRYKLGKVQDDIAQAEISKLLANGIIRKSNSPWCSPLVIVSKKDGAGECA
ncbi:hypothetical protein ENBRE01_1776 [Enteropsectra breve]|nr:hypothetical protein ENBRE01_1776 [Enteropsectra breve]